jgi:hypothetical protein
MVEPGSRFFGRRQRRKLDVSPRRSCLICAKPERLLQFYSARPQIDFVIGRFGIDHFIFVDPRFDAIRADLDFDFVPFVFVELQIFGGVVFGSIHAIDARQAHHAAAPAANDQAAMRILHREGEAAEEIVAFDFHRFECDLIIDAGGKSVGKLNAAEGCALMRDDFSVFDFHFAFAAEVGFFPAAQVFAVEEIFIFCGFKLFGGFGRDGKKTRKRQG